MADHPNEPSEVVQWAALIALPNGATDVEIAPIAPYRSFATTTVDAINRRIGPDVAKLVYRTATYGPWQSDEPADEWGVRYTWPTDGHVEYHPESSRERAEMLVRTHQGTSDTEVVSRRVEYGEWWLATATPAHQ